jgi:hypothetical protein
MLDCLSVLVSMNQSTRVALVSLACGVFACLAASSVSGQELPAKGSVAEGQRLRINVDLLGAIYQDFAQAPLGHESQGRIGWAIIGLTGEPNDRVSFLIEINPANDSASPKPACGEAGYFYPNVPDPHGPPVTCNPDGRDRVDLYRFVGLDPLTQQAMIRRAVVDLHAADRSFGVYLGRFSVPLGFSWLEMGSWTNEDATLIQRVNAEADFGGGAYGVIRARNRAVARWDVAAYRGDSKRSLEYSYSAFVDTAEDTNSDLTAAGRVTVLPLKALDLRVSGRYGFMGSKVDEYPVFSLSKRKDHAVVVSGQFRIRPSLRVFGEHATYWSGLPPTSARLIGLPPVDVMKRGYYAGAQATFTLPHSWQADLTVTHEDLSRDDSLVWYLSEQDLYRVHMGARVRSNVVRVSVRPMRNLELGAYWNDLGNPFPWLSGIVPVAGAGAFVPGPHGSVKWGFVFRMHVP